MMLSERNLTRKSTYCLILFLWSSKTGKTNLWWQRIRSLPLVVVWGLTWNEDRECSGGNGNVQYLVTGVRLHRCMQFSKLAKMYVRLRCFTTCTFYTKGKHLKKIFKLQLVICRPRYLRVNVLMSAIYFEVNFNFLWKEWDGQMDGRMDTYW